MPRNPDFRALLQPGQVTVEPNTDLERFDFVRAKVAGLDEALDAMAGDFPGPNRGTGRRSIRSALPAGAGRWGSQVTFASWLVPECRARPGSPARRSAMAGP
ncbi:MAG TPA: hypothetical protein VNF24_07415 [Candidatus Acidoferrales bacterium]|nr:hypothetical protein [Candidatus Acidoferrales bacterium]